MSNYSTKNNMNYANVRLMRDAKHFPASGDKPAATYFTILHSTKGQEDGLFVDVQVVRGAALLAGLKKGDILNWVTGPLQFKVDKEGELRGVIYGADVATMVNLKERAEAPAGESEAAVEGDAPAFD